MQILKEAQLLGYATVSQWITADGGKTVEMRMELNGPSGSPTKLHKVSTYDAKGHPTRMVLEIVGTSRNETIATFDGSGAHVSRMVHGITKNSSVARAVNAPWGDLSEFWFIRDHPKTGDHVRTLLFSVDASDWVLTELTFVGPKEISTGGRTIKANAVQSDADGRSSTAYLDDHGDPIRIELGTGYTMQQIVTPTKKPGTKG